MNRRSDKAEERWNQWCSDFDRAQQDVHTLLHTRWMWRAISSLLSNGNPLSYAVVTNYLTRTYVATVCTGARREADGDARTASLRQCIDTLLRHPSLVTRDLFSERAHEQLSEVEPGTLRAAFAQLAPNGGDEIDRAVLEQWRDELTASVEPVRSYTNQVLAHRVRNGDVEELTPSWDAINHALDVVGETLKRLYEIRHPTQVLWQATPVPDLEFVSMFRHPWYSDGWKPPESRDVV